MSKFLVIDCETGGLNPDKYSILSIGAVVWEDGLFGETIDIKIAENPCSVDYGALKVNQIDLREHLKNGKTTHESLLEFIEFVDSNFRESNGIANVCGHNVNFDIGFIQRLFKVTSTAPPKRFNEVLSHRTLDTMSILLFFFASGRITKKLGKLDDALDYFAIDKTNRHSALGDAIATAQLLTKFVNLDREGFRTLTTSTS